jgi:hypothetical protein
MSSTRQIIEYPPIEVFLNSRYASNADELYYNDCSWQLPRSVIAPEGYSLYVQLIDMTIPLSWHVVNQYCNELVINGVLYTLEPGNYSVRTLVSALSTLLSPTQVQVAFDSITLKCKLTSVTPITVSGSLLSVLGIVPSTGTTLSSLHTVDLTGQNSIYILSDFVTSNNNIDTRGNSSVFCRIPVTAAPMQVLQHEDYNGKSGLLLDSDSLTTRVLYRDGVAAVSTAK